MKKNSSMFLRSLRVIIALFVICASSVSAIAAPSIADLSSAAVNDSEWIGLGVHDLRTFLLSNDSLMAKMLRDQIPPEAVMLCVNSVRNIDFRLGVVYETEDLKGMAFACELSQPLNLAEYGLPTPEFDLPSPEHMTLTPLAEIPGAAVDGKGSVYVATLVRDGVMYLIGADSDPAKLVTMACAAENSAPAVQSTGANLWFQAAAGKETLNKALGYDLADRSVNCEIGVEDTLNSLRVSFASNLTNKLRDALAGDWNSRMTGRAEAGHPLSLGGGSLLALVNERASFIPDDLDLNELKISPKDRASIEQGLAGMGFTWSDVVQILRSNVTLGLVSAPEGAMFPGLYLNVGELSEKLVSQIMTICASAVAAPEYSATPYESGLWRGWKLSVFGVPMFVGSDSSNILIACMNPEQLTLTPSIASELLPAIETPAYFSVALDFRAFLPELKKLLPVLQMFGALDAESAQTASDVCDSLSVLHTVHFCAGEENVATLDIFFDGAKVQTLLDSLK